MKSTTGKNVKSPRLESGSGKVVKMSGKASKASVPRNGGTGLGPKKLGSAGKRNIHGDGCVCE
jgi:hypothetical protein